MAPPLFGVSVIPVLLLYVVQCESIKTVDLFFITVFAPSSFVVTVVVAVVVLPASMVTMTVSRLLSFVIYDHGRHRPVPLIGLALPFLLQGAHSGRTLAHDCQRVGA